METVTGKGLTGYKDWTQRIRSAWPPCCCSSSRDNGGDCVNAPNSEGRGDGTREQWAGRPDRRPAVSIMCGAARLASNRSVLWGNIRVTQFQGPVGKTVIANSGKNDGSDLLQASVSHFSPEGINKSWRHGVCVCVLGRHSNADALKGTFRVGFWGFFSGECYILLERQRVSVWYHKCFKWL